MVGLGKLHRIMHRWSSNHDRSPGHLSRISVLIEEMTSNIEIIHYMIHCEYFASNKMTPEHHDVNYSD